MGVQKLHVLNFDAATDAPWARLLAAMPIKDSPTATSALAFDLMLMIVDGASWPVAKALVVPENIQPFDCAQGTRCTGCQPMLPNSVHINPAGRVEHEFSNRVFVGMEGVVRQLATTRRCGRSGRATA